MLILNVVSTIFEDIRNVFEEGGGQIFFVCILVWFFVNNKQSECCVNVVKLTSENKNLSLNIKKSHKQLHWTTLHNRLPRLTR